MTDINHNIIPFCIFHNIDPDDINHKGIIVNPIQIPDKDGNISYSCDQEKLGQDWHLAGTFYAVTPMFRPIPYGMRLFSAKVEGTSTTDVTVLYGMFNFEPDSVYFITYNQPVVHTVPLYFHKKGDSVFPSFDEVPPGPEWGQTYISPIFVLIDGIVNPNNPNDTKFHCVNGRCLPWVKSEVLRYNRMEEKTPHTLAECIILCNEAVTMGDKDPSDILSTVALMSAEKPVIPRFFKKMPSFLIGFIIGGFVLVLFLILYFLFKNKNERYM